MNVTSSKFKVQSLINEAQVSTIHICETSKHTNFAKSLNGVVPIKSRVGWYQVPAPGTACLCGSPGCDPALKTEGCIITQWTGSASSPMMTHDSGQHLHSSNSLSSKVQSSILQCRRMRFAHAQYVHLVVGWGTLESRTVLRVESIAVDGDTIDEQLRVAARLRYRQSVPEGCGRWTQQIRSVKYSRGPDSPSCEECKGDYKQAMEHYVSCKCRTRLWRSSNWLQ